jgi:hypothetical protein
MPGGRGVPCGGFGEGVRHWRRKGPKGIVNVVDVGGFCLEIDGDVGMGVGSYRVHLPRGVLSTFRSCNYWR